jgi:hypothetical protein
MEPKTLYDVATVPKVDWKRLNSSKDLSEKPRPDLRRAGLFLSRLRDPALERISRNTPRFQQGWPETCPLRPGLGRGTGAAGGARYGASGQRRWPFGPTHSDLQAFRTAQRTSTARWGR